MTVKTSPHRKGIQRPVLVAALLCTATLPACTSYEGVSRFGSAEFRAPHTLGEYIIQPGDNLDIKLYFAQDLSENVTVRPDGKISLQLVDDIQAAGLTPQQLDDKLTKAFAAKLNDSPEVSVIVKGFADERIYVAGEVLRSGEYELKHKMTVLQAVTTAGGFLNSAKRDAVLVIRQQNTAQPEVLLASLRDNDLIIAGKEGTYAMLMPRDIVYVPKSNAAKGAQFMDQYVRDILRFNGFNAGVSAVYELNNKDTFSTGN